MARPKSFFPSGKDGRRDAIRAAKTRETSCVKYTHTTRAGKDVGFYVGSAIPVRLRKATIDKVF